MVAQTSRRTLPAQSPSLGGRRGAQLARVLDDLESAPHAVADALGRLRRWVANTDSSIAVFPRADAERLAAREPDAEEVLRLLTTSNALVPSEFKSPPPPHELCLPRDGAEIAMLLRIVARLGVSCPTVPGEGRRGVY